MEVAPGIHHFDTDPFNWYVIEERGRLTLVDAGFPGHYRVFLDGIRSIGRAINDVEAIVLPHAHADHTGFAEALREATGAPVFVHRDDLASATRILQLPWPGLLSNIWRPFGRSILWGATRAGVFSAPRITKARPFEDGDVLDVPGRPHALHAPGHTAGEVALYLPERGVLISGDTLITRDLRTGAWGRPQVPHRSLNADDRGARRSLDRLGEIGQVTMLPGHGRPWAGAMPEAIAAARSLL